ncbi:hypothetical protein JCM5296_007266 [Sporobolomyces johnsonii]
MSSLVLLAPLASAPLAPPTLPPVGPSPTTPSPASDLSSNPTTGLSCSPTSAPSFRTSLGGEVEIEDWCTPNPSEEEAQDGARRERQRREDDGTFGPGDYGWGTDITTTTIVVETTNYEPQVTTVFTTWGVEVTSVQTGEAVTISVYEGEGTTITLTPNVVTYTLFPTSTEFQTFTVTDSQTTYETTTAVFTSTAQASTTTEIPPQTITTTEQSASEASSTSSETLPTTPPPWLTVTSSTSTASSQSSHGSKTTSTTQPTPTIAVQSDCLPGSAHQNVPGLFNLTHDQTITLYVMAIYLVGITIAWNLFGIRLALYGFKSFTVFVHESGHAVGFLFSGLRLWRFTIDPNQGGATHTTPGKPMTPLALFFGQVFSIVFGGAMIFCGFDTLASKVASFVIMACWIPVIWFQTHLFSRLNCLATLGLLIGIWFIDHATGLRYVVLFFGVMSSFYIVWDTIDDLFHRKQHECCVVMIESHTAVPARSEDIPPRYWQGQVTERTLRSTAWFALWLLATIVVVVGCILAALAVWRQTPHGMYCQGQSLAPT